MFFANRHSFLYGGNEPLVRYCFLWLLYGRGERFVQYCFLWRSCADAGAMCTCRGCTISQQNKVVRTSAFGCLNWAGSISCVRTFQEVTSGLLRLLLLLLLLLLLFIFIIIIIIIIIILSTSGIELTLRH